MELSVILPVHNQKLQIKRNFNRILSYLNKIGAEVIVVENGSTDGSLGELKKLSKRYGFKLVVLKESGRGLALKKGIERARGTAIGYLDTDLGVPLRYIANAQKELRRSDLVIGNRYINGAKAKRTATRWLASKAYIALVRFAYGSKITDFQCGFKFFMADFAKAASKKISDNRWFFDTKLILIAEHEGKKICELPVSFSEKRWSTVRINDPLYFIKCIIKDKIQNT